MKYKEQLSALLAPIKDRLVSCKSKSDLLRDKYEKTDTQTKIFIWLRIVFLALAIIMFFCVPPPGFGVGLLAVVAACTSLHERQGIYQKASWIFLVILLLAVEGRSILRAKREENDRIASQSASQNNQFLTLKKTEDEAFIATMNGINQSISQSQSNFKKTIDTANALLEKSEDLQRRSHENLNATTGGDSFAYVMFTPWGVPPYLQASGNYPLHDLRITFLFVDSRKDKGYFSPLMEYKAGALGVRQLSQLFAVKFNLPVNDQWQVMTYFDALNGHWAEETFLKKVGTEWYESFTVRRDRGDGKFEVVFSYKNPKIQEITPPPVEH